MGQNLALYRKIQTILTEPYTNHVYSAEIWVSPLDGGYSVTKMLYELFFLNIQGTGVLYWLPMPASVIYCFLSHCLQIHFVSITTFLSLSCLRRTQTYPPMNLFRILCNRHLYIVWQLYEQEWQNCLSCLNLFDYSSEMKSFTTDCKRSISGG